MSRATGRHTRPKKLNAKQNVQIFREEQVELIDYDSARGTVETGVEKNEESEYHLQQAIKAAEAAKSDAKVKDAYIPTPPTIASDVDYDALYPKGYRAPATYIRSSATVEELAGVAYCMDEEDELALKLINGRLPAELEKCGDDQFEEVMNFFEETTQKKQPFAAVDNPPVLPLAELEEQYDDSTPPYVRVYAKFVYEHWKARREATGNRELTVHLKFETSQETDDTDPYVCFRRRELRQIRKTRARDTQSSEKLRRLRIELEHARNILHFVRAREMRRKEQLEMDRTVFELRMDAKARKRELGIKGDDEDFINQKPSTKRPHLHPDQQALAQQLRIPNGMRMAGDDLRTLDDFQMQRQEAIEKDIKINVEKHIRWNEGYVDKTAAPLTPASEESFPDGSMDFRQAMPATEYLPTPPASISDEENPDVVMAEAQSKDEPASHTPFRYASPVDEDMGRRMPSFRRRVGRGGRVMFDRRLPFQMRRDSTGSNDRFRYDSDPQEVEDDSDVDEHEIFNTMKYRAHLFGRTRESEAAQAQQAARRAQIEAAEILQAAQQPAQQAVPAS